VWTGCSICYTSWNFSCLSYGGIPLGIWDLTASARSNSKVGLLNTQAELIILHEAVNKAISALRARIAQVSIIGKCKFLVNSQNLSRTNKACFREELPLGSLVSKKFATSESSFTKLAVFWLLNCMEANLCRVFFQILNCLDAKLCH
jgi:hypothetical protein